MMSRLIYIVKLQYLYLYKFYVVLLTLISDLFVNYLNEYEPKRVNWTNTQVQRGLIRGILTE